MLKDKPYIIFLWISILSMFLIATKFFTSASKEIDFIYWLLVFRESLPFIGGVSLLIALLYWLLFKFKRPTHPILNIAQLLTLIVSYVALSYMVGAALRDSDLMMENMRATREIAILNYIFMTSMIATFVILALNVILSIAKPNIGRNQMTMHSKN